MTLPASKTLDGFSAVAQVIPIVLPLHPRTSHALERAGIRGKMSKGIYLIDPVGYLDMMMLEKNAVLIATDRAGSRKKHFFIGYRVSPYEMKPSGSNSWSWAGTGSCRL